MIPEINEMLDLEHTIAAPLFEGRRYAWEVLPDITDYILQLGPALPAEEFDHPSPTVWIAKDAKVFDSAYIGEAVIIDSGAEIRQCAFIRGSAIIGKNSVVGNSCEIKNAVIFDNCEIPHFNYVGDSVLGYHAHMGAGSVTSNVKADRKNVIVKSDDEQIESGRKKFGAMLGDWAEIGCNAVLNPGSVIGRHSNVYPLTCHRGVLPADCIEKNSGEVVIKKQL